MPLPNFLKNIFSGGASELVKTVSNVIDEYNLSPEEKEKLKADFLKATNEHIEKMEGLALQETEAFLAPIYKEGQEYL